ncbi:YqfZ [Bacillus cereus]|nr:YqfZ [Bacillus cereus]
MKRLGIFLFVLVLGYIFYYDIKIGTLPMLSSYKKTNAAETIKKKVQIRNKRKRTKRKKKQMSLIKQSKSKQVIRFFPLQKRLIRRKFLLSKK